MENQEYKDFCKYYLFGVDPIKESDNPIQIFKRHNVGASMSVSSKEKATEYIKGCLMPKRRQSTGWSYVGLSMKEFDRMWMRQKASKVHAKCIKAGKIQLAKKIAHKYNLYDDLMIAMQLCLSASV